jgi:hypothetical protein
VSRGGFLYIIWVITYLPHYKMIGLKSASWSTPVFSRKAGNVSTGPKCIELRLQITGMRFSKQMWCTLSLSTITDGTGLIKFRRSSNIALDAAFEFGELFYRFRDALDSLAFAAVRQITGDPVPNEDRYLLPDLR